MAVKVFQSKNISVGKNNGGKERVRFSVNEKKQVRKKGIMRKKSGRGKEQDANPSIQSRDQERTREFSVITSLMNMMTSPSVKKSSRQNQIDSGYN